MAEGSEDPLDLDASLVPPHPADVMRPKKALRRFVSQAHTILLTVAAAK
jgi:hypothetical protein